MRERSLRASQHRSSWSIQFVSVITLEAVNFIELFSDMRLYQFLQTAFIKLLTFTLGFILSIFDDIKALARVKGHFKRSLRLFGTHPKSQLHARCLQLVKLAVIYIDDLLFLHPNKQ